VFAFSDLKADLQPWGISKAQYNVTTKDYITHILLKADEEETADKCLTYLYGYTIL